MSLEQAINDHAAAIRELAYSISMIASGGSVTVGHARTVVAPADSKELVAAAERKSPNVGALARHGVPQVQPDAELEQAVQKVEAAAKKNAGAVDTATSTAGGTAGSAGEQGGTDQAEPLSYEKDVKPVLVKLAGAKGKDELTKLVKSFGVGKATELSAEQLPEVLEQANKLLAA